MKGFLMCGMVFRHVGERWMDPVMLSSMARYKSTRFGHCSSSCEFGVIHRVGPVFHVLAKSPKIDVLDGGHALCHMALHPVVENWPNILIWGRLREYKYAVSLCVA
jgi:hypothetical protein